MKVITNNEIAKTYVIKRKDHAYFIWFASLILRHECPAIIITMLTIYIKNNLTATIIAETADSNLAVEIEIMILQIIYYKILMFNSFSN